MGQREFLDKYCTTVHTVVVIDLGHINKNVFFTEQPFEPLDTGFSDELQKISSFNTSHNCTEQLNGTGIKAFKCFVVEFYKKQDYNNFAKHFWKIAAIWMVVYLVITLPLWFTRGETFGPLQYTSMFSMPNHEPMAYA